MKKICIILAGILLVVAIVFGICKMVPTNVPNVEVSGEGINTKVDVSKDTRRLAYKNALKNMIENNIMPDGQKEETADEDYDMSVNQYAILDVDGDGREELIVTMTHYPIAANRTIVYEYDVDLQIMLVQFTDFPAIKFYNNGIVKVDASHNHGWAGEALWPYSIYNYDKQNDNYDLVASVDAWTKEIVDLQSSTGAVFPTELDLDGDGVIYLVMPENLEGDTALQMDNKEYNEWRSQYISDESNNIEINYLNITNENVDAIA